MLKMLDTDICVYAMNGTHANVQKEMSYYALSNLLISSVTLAELYFGAKNSQKVQHNLQTISNFLLGVTVVNFDNTAANVYGDIRTYLRQQGTPIGRMDLLIAAHTLSVGATLVTNNTREFARVPNLLLENWVTI